jgi:hypothetical protein
MQAYSPGRRGRKKVVKQFTVLQGLLIVALIIGVMLAMMILWMLGVFRFDAD